MEYIILWKSFFGCGTQTRYFEVHCRSNDGLQYWVVCMRHSCLLQGPVHCVDYSGDLLASGSFDTTCVVSTFSISGSAPTACSNKVLRWILVLGTTLSIFCELYIIACASILECLHFDFLGRFWVVQITSLCLVEWHRCLTTWQGTQQTKASPTSSMLAIKM